MSLYNITTSKRENSKPMVFEIDIVIPPAPLILLINPASLEIKYAPKITEQRIRWTGLNGNVPYVFHAHHDELDTLTASGKSAMFMTDKGITRVDRTDSLAYENIQKLVDVYRNNGMNLNKKTNSVIAPCAINSVGRVVISYDGFMYKGHFINFSFTENDMSPFNVDFSFEFKVTRTFSSNQVSA